MFFKYLFRVRISKHIKEGILLIQLNFQNISKLLELEEVSQNNKDKLNNIYCDLLQILSLMLKNKKKVNESLSCLYHSKDIIMNLYNNEKHNKFIEIQHQIAKILIFQVIL
jgi:hypothetical protein